MSIELRSPYLGSLKECIQDLVVRFIINVPKEDLQTIERIFFQIEEAQWYYEDFVRELNPKLPSLKMPKFAQHIYEYCPQLWNIKDIKSSIKTFRDYKLAIPVCGAIIMTPKMNKILLVQAYDGNSWGFPRGKIGKDETKEKCAVREVYEEIGFDISPYLKPDKYVDIRMKGKDFRLYLVRGVPVDTVFETQTRKEISKIEWRDLKSMPGYARKKGSSNHFFMVTPFVPGLLKFIAQERGLDVPEEPEVVETDAAGETDVAESAPHVIPTPYPPMVQQPPLPFFGNFPGPPPGFGAPQGFPMPFMGMPGAFHGPPQGAMPVPAQFSQFQQMPQFQEFQEELQEAVGEPETAEEAVAEVTKPVEAVVTPKAPPPPSQLLLEGALRARKRDMSNAHSLLSTLRSGNSGSPSPGHVSAGGSGKAESLMALLNNPTSSKPVVRDLDTAKPKASSGLLALLNTQPRAQQKEEKKVKPSDKLLGLLTKSEKPESETQTQVPTRVPSVGPNPVVSPNPVVPNVASPNPVLSPNPGSHVSPAPSSSHVSSPAVVNPEPVYPSHNEYPNPEYPNPGHPNPTHDSISGLISSVPSEVDMLRLVSPPGATPLQGTPLPISEAELVASLTSQVSSPQIGTPLTEQDLIRSLQSQSATQLQAQLEASDGGDAGTSDIGKFSLGRHLHVPSQPTSEYVSEVESVPPALAPKPVRAVPKPLSEADLISHLKAQKLDDDDSDFGLGRDSSRSREVKQKEVVKPVSSSQLDAELLALLKPSTPASQTEDNELMGLLKGGSEWRPRKASVEVNTGQNELMSLLRGSTVPSPTVPASSGSSELLSMLKSNQQKQSSNNDLLSMLKGPKASPPPESPKNELLGMLKGPQPKNELLDMLKGGGGGSQPAFQDPAIVQQSKPVQKPSPSGSLLSLLNRGGQ